MKIIVISNSDESSLGVRKVLESFGDLDQIQILARIDSALRFDRVDLASAEVVIIDAEQVSEQDIRSIASIEQAHPHLSVIYLCNSSTHDELVQLIRAGGIRRRRPPQGREPECTSARRFPSSHRACFRIHPAWHLVHGIGHGTAENRRQDGRQDYRVRLWGGKDDGGERPGFLHGDEAGWGYRAQLRVLVEFRPPGIA